MESQNIASRRSLVYWAFFLTFLLGGGPIMMSDLMVSPVAHTIFDAVATAGFIWAAIAVIRAFKRNRATMLGLLGIGMFGAIFLQALHTANTIGLLSEVAISTQMILDPWTWNFTQLFLGTLFLGSSFYATREPFGDTSVAQPKNRKRAAAIGTIALLTIATAFFAALSLDLPSLHNEGASLSRSIDLVSGLMFAGALLLMARRGNWRRDSYGHGINILLIGLTCVQLFCMAFSKVMLDASFSAGHILQIISVTAIAGIFTYKQRVDESPKESEGSKPIGLGMGAKLGILCGFIAFLSVMPLAVKSTRTLHQIAAENGIDNLVAAAERSSAALKGQRMNVGADLNYLADATDMDAVRQISSIETLSADDARQAELAVKELDLISRNLLLSNPAYFSIAFIDATNGQTIVRQEQRSKADFAAANAGRLELKTNKLADTVLGAGKENKQTRSNIFLLKGSDQGDETSSLQVEGTALAVYSGDSYAPVGAFVLFSDISGAFSELDMKGLETHLYVVNSQGEFISHPNATLDALRSTDNSISLDTEFPELDFDSLLNSSETNGTIYRMPDGVEVVIGADRLNVSNGEGESLLYIFTSPRDQIEKVASEIGYEMQNTAQFVLLLAVVMGWFIARRLANPVKEISAAALDFGRDGTIRDLNVNGRDEIGMLAKSLTDMMTEVNGQRGRLMLLAAAVESSVDSIIITDNSGKITYVNPHYEAYSGVEASEIIGKTSTELPEYRDHMNVLSESTSTKGGETVWTGQYQWKRADGKMHEEALTISPIRNANGDIVSHSMMIQDITQRREMEKNIERQTEELMRSNKDLEQFAYVASHDLKAPLRAIEVILEWLRDDLEDYKEGDVQENLDLLSQRTSRLGRLLDDLLAYSRAGRQVGDVRRLDMKEFVEDIATLVAPPEGFQIIADESLPCIFAHHAPLETVMRNLINNAIKHHPEPENGIIRVSAKEQADSVVFSVEDNGEGIPEEYADKVFKMFQTLKPRDEREGSGMGLAIVQRIINWQNGNIWFKDAPGGNGVIFKFVWNKVPQEVPEIEMDNVEGSEDGEIEMAG